MIAKLLDEPYVGDWAYLLNLNNPRCEGQLRKVPIDRMAIIDYLLLQFRKDRFPNLVICYPGRQIQSLQEIITYLSEDLLFLEEWTVSQIFPPFATLNNLRNDQRIISKFYTGSLLQQLEILGLSSYLEDRDINKLLKVYKDTYEASDKMMDKK